MRVFRVYPHVEGASAGEPGDARYVHPHQGSGRWDNPDLYRMRYFGCTPEAAIAETFGSLARWRPGMFEHPGLGAKRRLAEFELPDTLRVAALAEPEMLSRFGMRANEVAERLPARTQRVAAQIYGTAQFDAISWWSYYHPSLTNLAVWAGEAQLIRTDALTIDHPAVQACAHLIVRDIHRGSAPRSHPW